MLQISVQCTVPGEVEVEENKGKGLSAASAPPQWLSQQMARTPPAPNSAACGVCNTLSISAEVLAGQVLKSCDWDLKGSRIFTYVIGFRKASNFAVKLALSWIFMVFLPGYILASSTQIS